MIVIEFAPDDFIVNVLQTHKESKRLELLTELTQKALDTGEELTITADATETIPMETMEPCLEEYYLAISTHNGDYLLDVPCIRVELTLGGLYTGRRWIIIDSIESGQEDAIYLRNAYATD